MSKFRFFVINNSRGFWTIFFCQISWNFNDWIVRNRQVSAKGIDPISFPESSFPLTSGRKTRALGATIFQACAVDAAVEENMRLRSETGWAEFGYFEMVAHRALVFRPLVKGNEDSGNEIGIGLNFSSNCACAAFNWVSRGFLRFVSFEKKTCKSVNTRFFTPLLLSLHTAGWPIRTQQAGKTLLSWRQCKLTGKVLKSSNFSHWRWHLIVTKRDLQF